MAKLSRCASRSVMLSVLSSCALVLSTGAFAANDTNQLFELSLQELLQVEVVSASRKTQSLSETAAAVFVISARDIELSGARSIPEALRLAPGLQVLQIDANKWSVSARGFSGRYANKLLVLMDGRTLFSPLYSGVQWDAQDIPLSQVDRIEVIRGPGGPVWGANAVNGVINIITKNTADTHGGLVIVGTDTESGSRGSIRYGAAVGDDGGYRVFAKVDDVDNSVDTGGNEINDNWSMARVGGRYDRTHGDSTYSIVAEAWSGKLGSSFELSDFSGPPYFTRVDRDADVDGGFMLANWSRDTRSGGNLNVQGFIDTTDRDDFLFAEKTTTIDLDIKYRLARAGRHEIQLGGGYRNYDLEVQNSPFIAVQPSNSNFSLANIFFQDEISFLDDRLSLIVGLKIEHYELFADDLEILPTLRGNWKVSDSSSVWGSVTKSVRTPAYSDLDVDVQGLGRARAPGSEGNPGPVPVLTRNLGNPNSENGSVVSYEMGYRSELTDHSDIDIAVFYSEYENQTDVVGVVATCEPSGINVQDIPFCVFAADYILATSSISNISDATTRGAEIAYRWSPSSTLVVNAIYSYLDASGTGTSGFLGTPRYGANAKHNFGLRTDLVISEAQSISVWPRYLSDVEFNRDVEIDSYWDLDVRYGWQATPAVLLEVVGTGLLRKRQKGYRTELRELIQAQTERTVYAELNWSF